MTHPHDREGTPVDPADTQTSGKLTDALKNMQDAQRAAAKETANPNALPLDSHELYMPEDSGDDWLNEVETSETRQQKRDLDIADLYIQGWDPAEGAADYGISASEFQTWLNGLDPTRRAELDDIRNDLDKHQAEADGNAEAIAQTAPELLTGRLSAEFEARIDAPYALGVTQLGVNSVGEAQQLITIDGGVPMGMYGPNQRFLLIDNTNPDYASDSVAMGYYRVTTGRFIVAFPVLGQEDSHLGPAEIVRNTSEYEQSRPANLYGQVERNGQTEEVVNNQYLAGFIDDHNVWHPNQNFMISNDLKLD